MRRSSVWASWPICRRFSRSDVGVHLHLRLQPPPSLPRTSRVKQERPGQLPLAWILLERLDAEARPDERRHDRAEPPEALAEVVVLPTRERVDAERDGMVVVHKELAMLVQRVVDAARPRVEVGDPGEHALRRVDEI